MRVPVPDPVTRQPISSCLSLPSASSAYSSPVSCGASSMPNFSARLSTTRSSVIQSKSAKWVFFPILSAVEIWLSDVRMMTSPIWSSSGTVAA